MVGDRADALSSIADEGGAVRFGRGAVLGPGFARVRLQFGVTLCPIGRRLDLGGNDAAVKGARAGPAHR